MPDPIEELENFNQQGLNVTPMSASEVRRRGDRMRRRNTALATVGSIAAAVIVIATPLAVIANRDGKATEPMPAPPGPSRTVETAWLQQIPAGFDLTALPAGASFTFTAFDTPVVDDFTLCGIPVFSTSSEDPAGPAVDTAGASFGVPNSEGVAGRTLALYRDDAEAHAALQAFRDGVESCPEDPNGSGATLVNRIEDSPLPADESFVYSQRSRMDADLLADLFVIQVARVGNALYLGTESGGPGDEQAVAFEVQRLATLSAPVLSDLAATFSAAAVAGGGSPGGTGEGAVSAIPESFPLLDGLPTDDQAATADFGRHGPRLDGDPMELLACDRGPLDQDTGHVERAVGGWRDVSESRERQLSTFATQAEATAYLEAVRGLLGACPEQDLGLGAVRLTTVGAGELGDESVVAVARNETDGEPADGLTTTYVVRSGRAVLVSQVVDEAAAAVTAADATAAGGIAAAQITGVVDAMCLFTTTGC